MSELMTEENLYKLTERVIARAREKGVWLTCAESCTGGLVAGQLTSVSGASDVFLGSVVSYDNRIKNRILGVPQEILDTAGAVSAPCAEAMASGVRRVIGADIAVSLTGIAGPTGGTAEKPVGLVFFGLSIEGRTTSDRCVFPGGRDAVRRQAVAYALNLLLKGIG